MPKPDVLLHRQVRYERKLLKDSGNAARLCFRRTARAKRHAVNGNSPGIRPYCPSEYLDESAFSGSILAQEGMYLASSRLEPVAPERAVIPP